MNHLNLELNFSFNLKINCVLRWPGNFQQHLIRDSKYKLANIQSDCVYPLSWECFWLVFDNADVNISYEIFRSIRWIWNCKFSVSNINWFIFSDFISIDCTRCSTTWILGKIVSECRWQYILYWRLLFSHFSWCADISTHNLSKAWWFIHPSDHYEER